MKVKMNLTNNQVAFEYAIYMMVGSYFKKAVCKNKMLEKSMRIQFLEQKEKKQYEMEDRCIRFIEKKMLPSIPDKFWNEEKEVHFKASEDGKITHILFIGKSNVLEVHGIYAGDNAGLYYSTWTKADKAGDKAGEDANQQTKSNMKKSSKTKRKVA